MKRLMLGVVLAVSSFVVTAGDKSNSVEEDMRKSCNALNVSNIDECVNFMKRQFVSGMIFGNLERSCEIPEIHPLIKDFCETTIKSEEFKDALKLKEDWDKAQK